MDNLQLPKQELIKRVCHDESARGQVTGYLYGRYVRVALSLLWYKEESDAHDATVDAIAKVLEKYCAGKLEIRSPAELYVAVFQELWNRVRTINRQRERDRKRYRQFGHHDDDESFRSPPTAGEVSDDAGQTADELAENTEFRRRLRECVDSLPDRERQVVESRFFQGLTQVATARVLGISRDQVRTSEGKALCELRRCLALQFPD